MYSYIPGYLPRVERTIHRAYCGGTLQSQNAASAYFTSNQMLPFDFAEQYLPIGTVPVYSYIPGYRPRVERTIHRAYCGGTLQSQNAASAFFTSNQMLPFGFAEQYLPIGTVPVHSDIPGYRLGRPGTIHIGVVLCRSKPKGSPCLLHK